MLASGECHLSATLCSDKSIIISNRDCDINRVDPICTGIWYFLYHLAALPTPICIAGATAVRVPRVPRHPQKFFQRVPGTRPEKKVRVKETHFFKHYRILAKNLGETLPYFFIFFLKMGEKIFWNGHPSSKRPAVAPVGVNKSYKRFTIFLKTDW